MFLKPGDPGYGSFTDEEIFETLARELTLDEEFERDREAELAGWPPEDLYWDAVSEGLYCPYVHLPW